MIFKKFVFIFAVGATLLSPTLLAGEFELEINDLSGLSEPWPLIGGLPFPEGVITDPAQIRISRDGEEVPAQVDVAGTWQDGSIRWAQAGFTAEPNGAYLVEFGEGVSRSEPEHPLTLEQDDDGNITVDTGVAVYKFTNDALLPDSVRMGEHVVVSDSGAGAYLIDNHDRLAVVAGERADIDTTILKSGTARTAIFREGWYVTDDGDQVARAQVWFYLAAGSPAIRITHSLILTENTNQWWIRDYGLDFKTPQAPERVAFALGETEDMFSPQVREVAYQTVVAEPENEEVYLYQDTYPHFMETEYRAVAGRRSMDRDPDLFWLDDWVGANDAAADWGDGAYEDHGLTVVMPFLSQRFPKAIAFQPDRVRVELWSPRGGRELDFRIRTLVTEYWQTWTQYAPDGPAALLDEYSNAQGMARTHEVWLMPRAKDDDLETVTQRAEAAAYPPLVLADPFWSMSTGVFPWPLHPRDLDNFPGAEALMERYWEEFAGGYQGRQPAGGGFLDWGKTRTMRGGRGSFFRLFSGTMDYYLSLHVWGAYARSGARGFYNYGSRINEFGADMGIAHWTAGDKFKGGLTGRSGYGGGHIPLYWGHETSLRAATPRIQSFLNEYYLTGNERMKYIAEMVGESYLERWDPEDVPAVARRSDGIFNNVAGLSALYSLDWDETYLDMARVLAHELIDLESPNALCDEIRFGSLYKVDRNLFWLYIYYSASGDPLAKEAILQSLDYKYRFSRFRLASGTQDWGGLLYSIAYEWTGNPNYLRVLNYLYQVGLERQEIVGFSYLQNHWTTINLPAAMTILAETDGPITPFPTAQRYAEPEPSTLIFRHHAASAPATFKATVWMEEDHLEPEILVSPLENGEPGEPIDGLKWTTEQAFMTSYGGRQDPHVYYVEITLPEALADGIYFFDIPRSGQIRVLESSVPEISVYGPQGLRIRGDATPNYFHVGEDLEELHLLLGIPMTVRAPDGSVALEASRDNTGEVVIPVEGRHGIWSVETLTDGVLNLLNVEPLLARSPNWLVKGTGLEPPPRFEQPGDEVAFVEGPVGLALHLPDRTTAQFERGDETEQRFEFFPSREGTIEFWFRPNWNTSEIPFARGSYTDQYWIRAGSHEFEYRRGLLRPSIGELSSVNLRLHGFAGDSENEVYSGHGIGYAGEFQFDAGEWYHVAATWTVEETEEGSVGDFRLFINGEAQEATDEETRRSRPRALVGEWPFHLKDTRETITIGPIDGSLSQLRISDTVRYREDFDPPESFDSADEETVVMFPLDGEWEGVTATGEPGRGASPKVAKKAGLQVRMSPKRGDAMADRSSRT